MKKCIYNKKDHQAYTNSGARSWDIVIPADKINDLPLPATIQFSKDLKMSYLSDHKSEILYHGDYVIHGDKHPRHEWEYSLKYIDADGDCCSIDFSDEELKKIIDKYNDKSMHATTGVAWAVAMIMDMERFKNFK